jgi:hypothetical protein
MTEQLTRLTRHISWVMLALYAACGILVHPPYLLTVTFLYMPSQPYRHD